MLQIYKKMLFHSTLFFTILTKSNFFAAKHETTPQNNSFFKQIFVVDAQENMLARLIGNYEIEDLTGISTISTDKANSSWYNLQGVKLNGKPSTAGIYINGGRKVIVK